MGIDDSPHRSEAQVLACPESSTPQSPSACRSTESSTRVWDCCFAGHQTPPVAPRPSSDPVRHGHDSRRRGSSLPNASRHVDAPTNRSAAQTPAPTCTRRCPRLAFAAPITRIGGRHRCPHVNRMHARFEGSAPSSTRRTDLQSAKLPRSESAQRDDSSNPEPAAPPAIVGTAPRTHSAADSPIQWFMRTPPSSTAGASRAHGQFGRFRLSTIVSCEGRRTKRSVRRMAAQRPPSPGCRRRRRFMEPACQ